MGQGPSGWGSARPTPREPDTLPFSDALSLGKAPEPRQVSSPSPRLDRSFN